MKHHLVTVEGDRGAGKTEMLLALSVTKATTGSKVLWFTSNVDAVTAHFERARLMCDYTRMASCLRSCRSAQITFHEGGEIQFLSIRSRGVDLISADMVVFDDFDFYPNPDDVAAMKCTVLPNTRFYKTKCTGEDK